MVGEVDVSVIASHVKRSTSSRGEREVEEPKTLRISSEALAQTFGHFSHCLLTLSECTRASSTTIDVMYVSNDDMCHNNGRRGNYIKRFTSAHNVLAPGCVALHPSSGLDRFWNGHLQQKHTCGKIL